MPRIVDDEPPIKTQPASKEYRDNWDRIFGEPCVHCGASVRTALKHYDDDLGTWQCLPLKP